MKLLAAILFIASTAFAQSVAVSVTLTDQAGATKTYSITLPAAVTSALTQFVADTKVDSTPNAASKYANVADLLIRHVNESLCFPLLQKYPDSATLAAAAAAKAADKAAADAAIAAAAPTVVVK